MTVKATENCVKSLMAEGINTTSIVVFNPTVTLDTVDLQSLRINCAGQVDTLSPSSENWFESFFGMYGCCCIFRSTQYKHERFEPNCRMPRRGKALTKVLWMIANQQTRRNVE